MYLFFGLFLIFCIIFLILNHRRKKCIIQKIRNMDSCEKVSVLNELLRPFGFSYLLGQDIITSRQDAWQRQFGYCALFDRAASHFNMVFDCEPVYFNYAGKTWLIEFWKGQYGINTGGEIGIYHADTILCPTQYDRALFHSASKDKMLYLSMQMFYKSRLLFSLRGIHWWLTGFDVGHFCRPGDLTMKLSVTFPNACMLHNFLNGLVHSGYPECSVLVCDLTVCFTFARPYTPQPRSCFFSWLSQLENRLFCTVYLYLTRPFCCTLDKLLYLYYYLPTAFRHMLRFRRCRKQKCPPFRTRRQHR